MAAPGRVHAALRSLHRIAPISSAWIGGRRNFAFLGGYRRARVRDMRALPTRLTTAQPAHVRIGVQTQSTPSGVLVRRHTGQVIYFPPKAYMAPHTAQTASTHDDDGGGRKSMNDAARAPRAWGISKLGSRVPATHRLWGVRSSRTWGPLCPRFHSVDGGRIWAGAVASGRARMGLATDAILSARTAAAAAGGR